MSPRSEIRILSQKLKESCADLHVLHIVLQGAWEQIKRAPPGSKEWFEANRSFAELNNQWNQSWTDCKRLQAALLTVVFAMARWS